MKMKIRWTPKQREKRAAIREQKSVLQAEIAISSALKAEASRKWDHATSIVKKQCRALDNELEDKIHVLETRNRKRTDKLEATLKPFIEEYEAHSKDVRDMKLRLEKLQADELNMIPEPKHCQYCGGVIK
jgi:hypothetical protein